MALIYDMKEKYMTSIHRRALALVANDEWHEAHDLIQGEEDILSCLIHGYLHREEGDLNNASYWYNQANQVIPDNTLEEEYERLYQMAQTHFSSH
jgi:hypothetical protein